MQKLEAGAITRAEYDVIVQQNKALYQPGGALEHNRKALAEPLLPSAISFPDVTIKYTFTTAKRLVVLQLDELKLLQACFYTPVIPSRHHALNLWRDS